MTWLPDAVRWYATLMFLTWGFAPLARLLCPRLPDRGAFVARPLALLAVVYPTWLLASFDLIPYSTIGLWLTLVVGAALCWGITWRRRLVSWGWLRSLLVAEVVSLVAFVAYALLRGYTPWIQTPTEKTMDVAFLASGARTTEMPPPDPWFAGEPINYYYLGYLLQGSLARMADVPVWVGYNLALAATFAMTITAAAGLGFNVARAWLSRRTALAAAALAAFFLPIAGNLHAPLQLLQHPRATIDHWWWPGPDDGGIGWESSRIVVDHGSVQPDTINEFPYFSFLLGDLHPHVTALPFTLVALALAFNLFQTRRGERAPEDRDLSWLPLALTGIVVGALYPLNSWDLPTYLVIALLAILAAGGWARATLERAAILVFAAVAAWMPFTVTFVPFAGGETSDLPAVVRDLPGVSRALTTVAFYDGERTAVGEFLTVFGIPWTIAVIFLVVEVIRSLRAEPVDRIPGAAIVGGGVLVLAAIAVPAPVLILAGAPLAIVIWLFWRGRNQPPDVRTAALGLFATGLVLVLGTEFFYIQDVFNGRFNTLFKVYYQVWSLFAIGGALLVVLLWREASGHPLPRTLLSGGMAVAIAAGLAYPVVASEQWTEVNGSREWTGLDGLEYIERLAPDDVAAIQWLAEHAEEDDVVLEAPGCGYQVNGGEPTSRLSAFTGVPTIIGWDNSESQWRKAQSNLHEQIDPRAEDVAAMYADPQSPLVDQYGVTLLFVGHFEQIGAGGACEKAGPFRAVTRPRYPGPGWTEVFASGEARIYRRD